MKLVRFDGGKTGLMVELPSGPHVLDVIGSLGALAPDDPISQGVLNGILKDNGKWSALIEHWPLARVGLRRLSLLALADSKGERLVIRRADEARIADPAEDPNAIVAIDITVPNRLKLDPTGREAMTHQFSVASSVVDDRVVVLDTYKTTNP
ncbi:hypothetical protein FFI89_012015 [Bradyrhizobium sp. KBS0727]|uniref:hypothetical protein n=1 Tax=unclassified Bradyrhizobium TaxID=2631580 RepID=UPI00110ECF4F|nr:MULTISPECIES: hypothetical protein [unclassified Bradyrhizobium]QDW37815.1 hypothetical protein FFI71_012010 [Bradyrhizobium sp. KBS0725]QDW44419.1 hypothetical protein FFI89_012015 [Bradyrhizobium sp. KBS0727]